MLTTQSLFEELQSEDKSFPSFKDLLNGVREVWQRHIGVLPVEIGPRDVLELAFLRKWVLQDENGAFRIDVPSETRRATHLRTGPKHLFNPEAMALSNNKTGATYVISSTVNSSVATGHNTIRAYKSQSTKS